MLHAQGRGQAKQRILRVYKSQGLFSPQHAISSALAALRPEIARSFSIGITLRYILGGIVPGWKRTSAPPRHVWIAAFHSRVPSTFGESRGRPCPTLSGSL